MLPLAGGNSARSTYFHASIFSTSFLGRGGIPLPSATSVTGLLREEIAAARERELGLAACSIKLVVSESAALLDFVAASASKTLILLGSNPSVPAANNKSPYCDDGP